MLSISAVVLRFGAKVFVKQKLVKQEKPTNRKQNCLKKRNNLKIKKNVTKIPGIWWSKVAISAAKDEFCGKEDPYEEKNRRVVLRPVLRYGLRQAGAGPASARSGQSVLWTSGDVCRRHSADAFDGWNNVLMSKTPRNSLIFRHNFIRFARMRLPRRWKTHNTNT